MHKRVGIGDAPRKRARRCVTVAICAAVGMRCGGKISCADGVGVRAAAEQILDARTIDTRRRAEDAIEARRTPSLPSPASGGGKGGGRRTACGGEWIFVVVLVARGNGLHGGVDERDLRRKQVAEQSGNAPGDVDARTAD